METESGFDESQFLADYISANFENDETYEGFFQKISENISCFARQNKNLVMDYFEKFNKEVRASLRLSLANWFLEHNNLEKEYRIKNKNKESTILSEIHDLFMLLSSVKFSTQTYDMSVLFSKITNNVRKSPNPDLITAIKTAIYESQAPLLAEISLLKSKVAEQSDIIKTIREAIANAQKPLINETNQLKDKITTQTTLIQSLTQDIDKINKLFYSKNQNSNNLFTFSANNINNQTPVQQQQTTSFQKPSYSSMAAQNTPGGGIKRPRTSNNEQKTLKSFNSFDPHSHAIDIDLTKENDGFKTVYGRKNFKKSTNNHNNNNNNNRNNNNNNRNSNNYNNKNNQSKVRFVNTLGTGSNSTISTASKQFFIYLGRLSLETSKEQVQNFLNNTFKNVKINGLEELNSENEQRSFKSFKFSVDYLDKNILDNKELWPRNSVVTKFKLPLEQWQEIVKKIEEKKKKTAVAQNGTISSVASLNKFSNKSN